MKRSLDIGSRARGAIDLVSADANPPGASGPQVVDVIEWLLRDCYRRARAKGRL